MIKTVTMKKRIFIIFIILAFFGIMLYIIKPYKFIEIINNSNKFFLILAFLLQLNSLLLRSLRWKFIIGKVKLKKIIPVEILGVSVASFSPLKSGDAFKAYLLKKQIKIPMSKGLPTILWEEITNVVGYMSISLLSISFLSKDLKFLFFVSIIFFGAVIFYTIKLLYSKRNIEKIAKLIERLIKKIKWIKIKWINKKNIKMFEKSGRLGKKKFMNTIILALLIAINDGSTFFMILKSVGININYFYTISAFCAAMIMGSLFIFLPAGIGSIDGLLIALFSFAPIKTVMSAVLILRILTLWFTGLLGLIIYLFIKR